MFALLAFVSLCFADYLTITDCLNGTGPILPTSAYMEPDPAVRGEDLTVNFTMNVTETVDTLDCTAALKVLSITLQKYEYDICTKLGCPLSEGEYSFSFTKTVPSTVPIGTFVLQVQCTDADGNDNLCVKTNVTISNITSSSST